MSDNKKLKKPFCPRCGTKKILKIAYGLLRGNMKLDEKNTGRADAVMIKTKTGTAGSADGNSPALKKLSKYLAYTERKTTTFQYNFTNLE